MALLSLFTHVTQMANTRANARASASNYVDIENPVANGSARKRNVFLFLALPLGLALCVNSMNTRASNQSIHHLESILLVLMHCSQATDFVGHGF